MKRRIAFTLLLCPSLLWAQSISLTEAETIALQRAPEIQGLMAKQQAYQAKAIADDQLPDPKLMLGAMNVPTDTFSFTQENMTQIQLGVMQQFPKGDSLAIKSAQDQLQGKKSEQQVALDKLKIKRWVRSEWLQLYYWQQAKKLYQQEQKTFEHLAQVTQANYSNHNGLQKDVVRAQLETSNAQQKTIDANLKYQAAKEQLLGWLWQVKSELAIALPKWPTVPSSDAMLESVKTHPLLQIDQLDNQVGEQEVKLAEQDYKPGYSVAVMYGARQGDDNMGDERSDFVGTQVSLDLPVFTANRQDKKVAASEANYTAIQKKEATDYRELVSQTRRYMSTWQQLNEQQKMYEDKLLPAATHYTQATLLAYQNGQTDFPTLARAYIEEYQTKLSALKNQVALKQARAELLYLQGK